MFNFNSIAQRTTIYTLTQDTSKHDLVGHLQGRRSVNGTRKNLNDKRVCDISNDRKVVEIVQKGCLTRITANPDGTLKVENVPLPKAA